MGLERLERRVVYSRAHGGAGAEPAARMGAGGVTRAGRCVQVVGAMRARGGARLVVGATRGAARAW